MNHWLFVSAAYLITAAGTALLAALSWAAMRRAESAAESLRRDR